MHPVQQERVQVVSGRLRFRIRGWERSLASGETVVVNPGEAHEVHNECGEDAVFVVEVSPALKTERGLEVIFGLAKEGKTNQNGRPKNVLQRGIIAYESMNEVALSGIPLGVQRSMVASLAALGQLLGYIVPATSPTAMMTKRSRPSVTFIDVPDGCEADVATDIASLSRLGLDTKLTVIRSADVVWFDIQCATPDKRVITSARHRTICASVSPLCSRNRHQSSDRCSTRGSASRLASSEVSMVGRLRSARGTREPRCTTRGLRCGLDVPVDRLRERGRRLSVRIAVIDATLTNPWLAPARAEGGL